MRYRIHSIVIVLILMLCAGSAAQAQVNTKMYEQGTIVTASGDTLSVMIRRQSDDRIAKSITVLSEDSMETKRYLAKDLQYIKIGQDEFFMRYHENKRYMMKRVISGPASLYELPLREKKGSKYEVDEIYYVEKEEPKTFVLIDKKNFKTSMYNVVRDNQELAQKIEEKYYTYTEKEAVVEAYNEWVKQGRPGKTWQTQDGNFTRPEKEYKEQSQQPPSKFRKPFTGSRLGIDIPLMASYSFVTYPEQLNVIVQTRNGGFGYNMGIGVRYNLSPSFLVRAGINFRNKRFESTYGAVDTAGTQFTITEAGTLHYFGLYAMIHYESRNLTLGAGFDISYANIYRAKYRIYDMSGGLHGGNEDESESILVQNGFKPQCDLVFNFGYKINLANDLLRIKPVFQYSIPLVSMFDVTDPVSSQVYGSVNGYLVQLGLIIDVGFKQKQIIVDPNDLK